MDCTSCLQSARRFGKNRNGSQRYCCDACKRTFTDADSRPTDRRFLESEKAVLCLRMLLEGNSARSVERLLNIHRDTVIATMVAAGEKCQRFLENTIRGVAVADVEVDELWGFVGCKERTRLLNNYAEEFGDAYCFTAIERTTKLMLAWHVGKRTPADTLFFAEKLDRATSGRFQLTSDGFRPYLNTIPAVFGHRVNFATMVKTYDEPEDERRYSPARVTGAIVKPISGQPDMDRVCTSHVERANLSVRMAIRRLTRLTNAHSKTWRNHEAALGLFFGFYNYCRVHSTLKTTPAVGAGLADRTWSVQELLNRATH